MKVRSKITIIVIVVACTFALISSGIFLNFFTIYLNEQEALQISTDKNNLNTYLSEKTNKYQSTVNDYSHWNDTYDFVLGINTQQYISENFAPDTFANIDVSFMIFVDPNSQVIYKQYFDVNEYVLTDFPPNFNRDIQDFIIETKTKDEASSILTLGDQSYFIATSEVTDSNMEKTSKAKMIVGRLIDDSILDKMKEITNSEITLSTSEDDYKLKEGDAKGVLQLLKSTKQKNTVILKYVIPKSDFEGSHVVLTQTKPRDLYENGMKQIIGFILIYSIVMVAILFSVFTLLGRYLSKPIIQLTSEVKTLDLTKKEITQLEVTGRNEFSFLRNAINQMLNKIELEQEKVKENEEKLLATLMSVGDGVIAVDRNGLVTLLNPIAEKLTGWSTEEANGKPFEAVFHIINEYTREKVENPVNKVFETNKVVELANHTILISKDKTENAIEDTAAPIITRSGINNGVVLVFRDVSDKKEKRKQIEYLSYHDQLTGLYNRRFFEEELNRLDTVRNMPLTILFADVNGLKTINDAFGHQYGDMLIQIVSDVFKKECRSDDIIARIGGDEFVFLFSNTEEAYIADLVNRITGIIEEKKVMDINISISFGWDTKVNRDQSIWSVLKNAEDFMYQKKIYNNSSKRNEVVRSILHTLQLKNPREEAHSKRVSMICEELGRAFDLSPDQIKELKTAGELHDIGKIAIDEIVLNKAGELTDVEWAQMQRHPEIGFRLLGTSNEFYNIAEYVLAHHERWDGKGYPNRLKGEAIPWISRIIMIADAYDAMTSDRPYRKALQREEVLKEISLNVGKQFDPDIARMFAELIENGKI